jgi:ATP-binding cassette subfamily F protein 3
MPAQALVQAINGFTGAVVLISHDPHLIELTADRLWLVADGTCRQYDGDLDDYRRLLLEDRRERAAERRQERQAATGAAPAGHTAAERKAQRRAAAEARAGASDLKRAAAAAEKRLEQLNQRRVQLEARLADPAVYGGPTTELMQLQLKFGEIKKAIADAEERWLEAQAALE